MIGSRISSMTLTGGRSDGLSMYSISPSVRAIS